MRFNDLLRTVFANDAKGIGATITRWRQCIDIIAQYDVSGAPAGKVLADDDLHAMLELVDDMRPRVPVEQRIASIIELGSRLRSTGLVRLLSQDHPSLVVAMMASVRLTDGDWAAIIPDLGPLARSVLRRRADLGPAATMALGRFGETDLALPSSNVLDLQNARAARDADMQDSRNAMLDGQGDGEGNEPLSDAPSQIGLIVARIERFAEARANRIHAAFEPSMEDREDEEPDPQSAAAPPVQDEMIPESAAIDYNDFRFETDASGLIQLSNGAPRAAAFGLSIATPALDSRLGADGTALGAFRRRASFENARFTIGEGALAGEWRISADPRFDRLSGRFLGYEGSARREYPHESLVKSVDEPSAMGWSGLSAASTRQLIHELRTPLNAIQGYSEMIEVQMLGPVAEPYREMARTIMQDARALLATFDDLDAASRIERGDTQAAPQIVDLATLLSTIVASFDEAGQQPVLISGEASPSMVAADRAELERMLTHMVRAGRVALSDNERLQLQISSDASRSSVNLIMHRPALLQGVSEQDLMDHGYMVDQRLREPPLLGLAFTLKLVAGIAKHLGGRFTTTSQGFKLSLPAAAISQSGQEGTR